MALDGEIKKGQSDGNLDTVFANTVSEYWFCLEIFKVVAFMSEAQDSREVQRGYWDSWSATNVDLAQSEGLSLAGEGLPVQETLLWMREVMGRFIELAYLHKAEADALDLVSQRKWSHIMFKRRAQRWLNSKQLIWESI